MRKPYTNVRQPAAPATPPRGARPVHIWFDGFELDEANARLLREQKEVALAPTPFAVLCSLARQPGALITKDALLDEVWGHRFVSDSVLKTAVSEVRSAFTDDARQPQYIETVSRRGYRFIGAVSNACMATSLPARAAVPSTSSTASRNLATMPSRPTMIGRHEETGRLRAAWARACSGQPTMVWVIGDAGIGKTTLIDSLSAKLGEDVAIARGQCVKQFGAGESYLPILEALAALCRVDDALIHLLRSVAPAWLMHLPWLNTPEERQRGRRELSGACEHQMMRELAELLDAYTEHRPLLLITEDMHWSDHATVELMDYIARRRGRGKLMWLASFRLAEVIAYDHPLKALRPELRLHGLCEEIGLEPFSEQDVDSYVADRLPSRAGDSEWVRALHEQTDGVPLFLAHVMDLLARGELRGADVPLKSLSLPEGLAGVIDLHVSRLPPEQLRILETAAVCGLQFKVATLAAVLSLEPASVASICEELAGGRVWLNAVHDSCSSVLDSQYVFQHTLVRQRLCERLNPTVRKLLENKVEAAREPARCIEIPLILRQNLLLRGQAVRKTASSSTARRVVSSL
jgi:DNA-binding winged helix-turn-helix (wHTH) protein